MTHQNYNVSIDESGLIVESPTPPKEFIAFPVNFLPEPLKSLAIEGAEAMQCDPVLVVLPMLATVGAAIGNARRVMLKAGWSASPCLWTMFIAESGSVKTPAFRLAKAPLEALEQNANQRYDDAEARYASAQDEYLFAKKKHDKNKEGEPPKKPTPPTPERFIVKDTTLAALVEILRDNPRGLLVPTDELAGWFGSFNKHDQGGGDAQHWLSIYSGESISVDRKGNRSQRDVIRPIKVYSPFVSITGAIQPGLWHSVLGDEHQASGMAARFLLAWPPRRAKVWTDDEVSESTSTEYNRVIESLAALKAEQTDGGHYKAKYIGLNYKAKRLWQSFYNTHNEDHLDRHGSLAAASSKIEEIPARIALILHNVKLATGEVDTDQVDEETMRTAIEIAKWFMAEAERIYGIVAGESVSGDRRQLVEWIRMKGGSVTAAEVAKGNRRYPNSEAAESQLQALAQIGWGQWEDVKPKRTGGRPTRRFTLVTVGETPPVSNENVGCDDTRQEEPPKNGFIADDDDIGEVVL